MTTFQKKMLLSIVDKLILCLILIIGKYFFDKRLNDFQTQKAFEQAVAVKRIEAISELWPYLNALEDSTIKAIVQYDNLFEKHKSDTAALNSVLVPQHNAKAAELGRQSIEVLKEIDKRRFWLGKKVHGEFQAMATAMLNLVGSHIHNVNLDSKIRMEIYQHRSAIFNTARSMF